MFCNKCGKDNAVESKFCSSCGAGLATYTVATDKNKYSAKSERIGTGSMIFMLVFFGLVVKSCLSQDGASTETTGSEPNVNHVSRDVSVTQTQADAIVKLIRVYGYSCSSLSSAIQSAYDGSYSVTCNDWRYRYEIEDVGGTWTVTVD